MSRDRDLAVRLFLNWLNQRFAREFSASQANDHVWLAQDGDTRKLAVTAMPLYDADQAWDERRQALERRLDESRPGSYMLWVPPGGVLPAEEPDESEFVRRVVLAASKLASGRGGEVRLPVKLTLGKVRDEGGYANVIGGLARQWTTIAARLQGSFFLDSQALKRFTIEETEREQLYENVALLGQGLTSGDAVEFEHDDAWSLQRLPRGPASEGAEEGWAISGCPPGFDPNDGSAVRRMLRPRLSQAREALAAFPEAAKVLVLIGGYDYMSNENVGPSLRGFDPSLTLPFDIIGLVADAEVKPILLSPGLKLAPQGDAP